MEILRIIGMALFVYSIMSLFAILFLCISKTIYFYLIRKGIQKEYGKKKDN